MQARTLRSGVVVGQKCRQCSRVLVVGDRVIVHELGRDAPWDLRRFVAHAHCVAEVLGRFKKTGSVDEERAELAAEFRDLREQLLAGAVSLPS